MSINDLRSVPLPPKVQPEFPSDKDWSRLEDRIGTFHGSRGQ
ncbi:hypothetical protein B0G76_3449 [Paraburkholderia sp. BL23I1N1]|nr:hypothetical protein B0G76_3449 [Paraburkholderia sp. BL23I1N1]